MLSLNLPPCCYIFLPYITSFDVKIIHQRVQTTCLHASHCHHCHYGNVGFVCFQDVTHYTSSILSRIHVNTLPFTFTFLLLSVTWPHNLCNTNHQCVQDKVLFGSLGPYFLFKQSGYSKYAHVINF
jgi:hypothetical protein